MPGSRHAFNNKKVATYCHKFEDAPRASVTTHGKQREGRHLRPEFRGRSTRQRHDTRKTTRRSTLTPRISRTPPRASVTTRLKQREGRHLRPEFRERSTRHRHDAPETARRSPLTPRISRTLHAPVSRRAENNDRVATYAQNFADSPRASVTTHRKLREGRHLRPEFRGRSTRQRHDTRKTTRGSPLTPRISRTLHAPASRHAENNDRVATYAQNFEDAPRASVTTHRKLQEGRLLRPEFRGRSTRQRHDTPQTTRGSPLTPSISRTLHAPASPHAENNQMVATYVQNFEDAPCAGRPTDRPTD